MWESIALAVLRILFAAGESAVRNRDEESALLAAREETILEYDRALARIRAKKRREG